jgi:hypothetical protein
MVDFGVPRRPMKLREELRFCLESLPSEISGCGQEVGKNRNIVNLADKNARQKLIKVVPLEGLEPPTVSLGRNCSSIELQRLAQSV